MTIRDGVPTDRVGHPFAVARRTKPQRRDQVGARAGFGTNQRLHIAKRQRVATPFQVGFDRSRYVMCAPRVST